MIVIHEVYCDHETLLSVSVKFSLPFPRQCRSNSMGNCNPRALLIYSSSCCVLSESCFLTVLFLEAKLFKSNADKSCWSNFAESSKENAADCPFFALFVATVVNGLLILFISSYLLFRMLRKEDCFLRRIPLFKVLFRYGPFFTNVFTTLLNAVFIGLLIGYKSQHGKYTGEVFDHKGRLYLVLIVTGFCLIFIASVTTGLLAYQRRTRSIIDEFEEGVSIIFPDDNLDIN